MKWKEKPSKYEIESNKICRVAEQGTNLFNSPSSDRRNHIFPFWFKDYEGDFLIKCKVTPEFLNTYDQGDIIIWENEDKWIKLAYENSDNGYPAIVSVVTDGKSDDCTGNRVTGSVWLLVCRKENTFALHYSEDGVYWNMARIFSLKMAGTVQIGISAQSPSGKGCRVLFENLSIEKNHYTNIRNINLRKLFTIDKKNYDKNGTSFKRPSVRGIIIKSGNIAMIHSLKYDYYKFPGGGIEAGETYKDALIREVREESGLNVKADTIKEFGYVLRIEKGKIDDIFIQYNYYYLCEVEEKQGEQGLDDYEKEEQFVLEFVSPEYAIEVNKNANHKEKGELDIFKGMVERENRVLELVQKEVIE